MVNYSIALLQMTLWDSAAESKMELMMCQDFIILNVSGLSFTQFESENVFSLLVTNNETNTHSSQTLATHLHTL